MEKHRASEELLAAAPRLTVFLGTRFAAVVLLQTLLLILAFGLLRAHEVSVQTRRDNEAHAADLGARIDGLFDQRLRTLTQFAVWLPAMPGDDSALRHMLRSTLTALDGAVTAIAIDDTGRVVAGAPELMDADGDSVWGNVSVADRDYFRVPLQRGGAFVSPLFRGRGFGRELLLALSVAVPRSRPDPGQVAVVEASLPLSVLAEQIAAMGPPDAREYAIVSPGGVLAVASPGLQWPTFSIVSQPLLAQLDARATGAAPQWISDPALGGQDWLISAFALKDHWRVLVMFPRRAYVAEVVHSLVWPTVACVLIGAALLLGALVVARRLGGEGERYAARIEALTPANLEASRSAWRAPKVAFREAGRVYAAVSSLVRRMQVALAEQRAASAQLEQLRASLEKQVALQEGEIQSRTNMLLTSSAELRSSQQLLEDAQVTGRIGIWSWQPDEGLLFLSSGAQRLLGTPPLRDHVPLEVALASVSSPDRERAAEAFERCRSNIIALATTFQICDDRGRSSWLLMRGAHGRASGSSAWVFRGTILDISERYLAETRLARFADGVEQLCRAAVVADAPVVSAAAMLDASRGVAEATHAAMYLRRQPDAAILTLDPQGTLVPVRRRNEFPPDLLDGVAAPQRAWRQEWNGEPLLLARAEVGGCTAALMFSGFDRNAVPSTAALALVEMAAQLIAQALAEDAAAIADGARA